MEKCDPNGDYRPENAEKQCGFDLTSLGPCNRGDASGFGYKNNAPCLYLRLSKVSEIYMKPKIQVEIQFTRIIIIFISTFLYFLISLFYVVNRGHAHYN